MYEEISQFSYETNYPFNISISGISYCDGSYKIIRPNSSIYTFEYIIEGTGYVEHNGHSFFAKKGDIYILPRGQKHYYYSDKKNPWTKIWFNIYGDFVDKTLESYNLRNVDHIEGFDLSYLFYAFLDITRSNKTRTEIYNECSHIFLTLVQKISEKFQDNSFPDDTASKIKYEIDECTNSNINLDEIAKKIFCTKSHAIRIFKSKFGITPYQYILKKKLSASKLLLKSTNMTIYEISEQLSFCDSHYFSSFFKSQTGITPKNYRKIHRESFSLSSTESVPIVKP